MSKVIITFMTINHHQKHLDLACRVFVIPLHFLQKRKIIPICDIFNAGMEPREFHSVARVGSGNSMDELSELLQKLSLHWQHVIPGQCPPGLAWTKEKPDVWIAPPNSYILEVHIISFLFLCYMKTWYII
jgi:hypothetical protein